MIIREDSLYNIKCIFLLCEIQRKEGEHKQVLDSKKYSGKVIQDVVNRNDRQLAFFTRFGSLLFVHSTYSMGGII